MKLFRRSMIVLMVIVVLVSCVSTKEKTVVLDHKGASFGLPEPAWLLAFVGGAGNPSVEALPEYRNQICFVLSEIDANRDFAIGMVDSANVSAAVARVIATTVMTNAKAMSEAERGDDQVSAAFSNTADAMSNASYTGLRKAADWWRIVENKSTKERRAEAYVLYTIDSKLMSDQIARNLANIMENNRELSAAEREIYRDLIAHIRTSGFKQ